MVGTVEVGIMSIFVFTGSRRRCELGRLGHLHECHRQSIAMVGKDGVVVVDRP